MSRKILILYAHPDPRQSEAGAALIKAAQSAPGVTVADLYAEYPRFDINAAREQARLAAHDVLVFQFPLYWYSTPALLKEWQDVVLQHDFAYGVDGNVLGGKLFFCAVTTGGPEAAYKADAGGHVSMRDLLTPLQQTALLCGMTWIAPFVVFSARRVARERRLYKHAVAWLDLLGALREDRLDIERAKRAARLDTAPGAFITPPKDDLQTKTKKGGI